MIQPSPRRCCCCPEAPLSPPSTLIPPQTTTDRLAESRAALERKAEEAERAARGAEERLERMREAAASARRVAEEHAWLHAEARDDAVRAREAYASAQEMHQRAFQAAKAASPSFKVAAAEIKAKRLKIRGLLLGLTPAPGGA